MALTTAQAAIWEKARSLGTSDQAVPLTDGMCAYLIARIAADLGLLQAFPEFTDPIPEFFTRSDLTELTIEGHDVRDLFTRLVAANSDADTYFACLATLHKARLKYERILSMQPFPTLEQVGPRGILQYGKLGAGSLVGFMFWRKWFFDIDNRAGQDTGYLFEPIIAYAIGGTPAPSKKSPVKRHADGKKGRQVDCIRQKRAYEFKIRVTIAASGQGRWSEELDFPIDCRASGYTPVLLCMDGTSNPKLDQLVAAFLAQKGEVYVGQAAWQHLDSVAGKTMAQFIDTYVRTPINDLLASSAVQLPDLVARFTPKTIVIEVGGERLEIDRLPSIGMEVENDPMPEDADTEIPGT